MARIFVRDEERLRCEIRPAETGGGFELVWTQDGEDYVEHFPLESEARAHSNTVAETLILGGWFVAN